MKSDNELRMARLLHHHSVTMECIKWGGRVLCVATFALIVKVMQPIFDSLAGKTTNINMVVTVSVVVNIALAWTIVFQYTRGRVQSTEIQRLRSRENDLEQLILLISDKIDSLAKISPGTARRKDR